MGGAPSISGASRLPAEVWGSLLLKSPLSFSFLLAYLRPGLLPKALPRGPVPLWAVCLTAPPSGQHLHTPRWQGAIPQLWEVEPGWPAGGCRHPPAPLGSGHRAEDSSDRARGGGWNKHSAESCAERETLCPPLWSSGQLGCGGDRGSLLEMGSQKLRDVASWPVAEAGFESGSSRPQRKDRP